MTQAVSENPPLDRDRVLGLNLRKPSRPRRLWQLMRALPSETRVGYVGWLGHFNIGDEAMYAAYQLAFPGLSFLEMTPRELELARRVKLRPLSAFALGGGTLIGHEHYRRQLELMMKTSTTGLGFMLGTGVEDPEFYSGPMRLRVKQELAAWGKLLQEFSGVSVRGPRSKAILADLGVEATVVGDPALLLADPEPTRDVDHGLLGVNLSPSSGPIWGDDPGRMLELTRSVLQQMIATGWRVRLVPFWNADVRFLEELAAALGPRAELVRDYLNLERLIAALRPCHVFLGQKLHSVVMASAAYVPSVMLEYQPKCLDFQASLGREELTLRTSNLDPGVLERMLRQVAEDHSRHQGELFDAVSGRRSELVSEAARIRAVLAEVS